MFTLLKLLKIVRFTSLSGVESGFDTPQQSVLCGITSALSEVNQTFTIVKVDQLDFIKKVIEINYPNIFRINMH